MLDICAILPILEYENVVSWQFLCILACRNVNQIVPFYLQNQAQWLSHTMSWIKRFTGQEEAVQQRKVILTGYRRCFRKDQTNALSQDRICPRDWRKKKPGDAKSYVTTGGVPCLATFCQMGSGIARAVTKKGEAKEDGAIQPFTHTNVSGCEKSWLLFLVQVVLRKVQQVRLHYYNGHTEETAVQTSSAENSLPCRSLTYNDHRVKPH